MGARQCRPSRSNIRSGIYTEAVDRRGEAVAQAALWDRVTFFRGPWCFDLHVKGSRGTKGFRSCLRGDWNGRMRQDARVDKVCSSHAMHLYDCKILDVGHGGVVLVVRSHGLRSQFLPSIPRLIVGTCLCCCQCYRVQVAPFEHALYIAESRRGSCPVQTPTPCHIRRDSCR